MLNLTSTDAAGKQYEFTNSILTVFVHFGGHMRKK